MGILAKPNVVISMGDDGFITLKSVTTFKTTEFKFKLNEEYDEDTADGRATKVGHPRSSQTLFYTHFKVLLKPSL